MHLRVFFKSMSNLPILVKFCVVKYVSWNIYRRHCIYWFVLIIFLGSHGPLLPLPSRYRMGSRDTPELVAYPLPQASSSYMHGGNPSGSVVMVSGLHQLKMNCSRVFNLFCLYGNIEKVSFILYSFLPLGYWAEVLNRLQMFVFLYHEHPSFQ